MSKLPTQVPLPEVGEHTEDIVFGHLGLPVGFDEERLIVNLRSIERVRSVAGLGIVSITSERGDVSGYDYDVTSMNGGAATMGAVKKQPRVPASRGSVRFPYQSSMYGNPDASITLNTAEIEERIKEKHGTVGVFDPKPRAKQLNSAIKSGLQSSVMDANVDLEKFKAAGRAYGVLGVLAFTVGSPIERAIALPLIAAPIFQNMAVLRESTFRHMTKEIDSPFEMWVHFRKSVFPGPAFDRVAVANGLLKVSRLVKAR